MLNTTRRDSIGTLSRKSRTKRAYLLWKMRKENWLQQTWRRLRYKISYLPWSSPVARILISLLSLTFLNLTSLNLYIGTVGAKSPLHKSRSNPTSFHKAECV